MKRNEAHLVQRITNELTGTAFCLAVAVLTGGCDVGIWARQWGRECATAAPCGPGFLTLTEKVPLEKALAVALDSDLGREQMQAIYDRFTQAATTARESKQKVREAGRQDFILRCG